MDAQNKAFQYRYVFLTIAPIVVACLILLLSFTFIHGQKTVSFDRKIGNIAQMFFREPKAGYLEKTYLFERHSKQLLELGYFVSFALLVSSFDRLVHTTKFGFLVQFVYSVCPFGSKIRPFRVECFSLNSWFTGLN